MPGEALQNKKADIPEGMSKNAWKKLQKRKKWEDQKEDWKLKRREKKLAARRRKAERKANDDSNGNTEKDVLTKRKVPDFQETTNIKVIMDCEFDDLMSDKEVVSLSNQITRCYSAMRHSGHELPLTVSCFNKRLKSRFDKTLPDHAKWKNIRFDTNATLEEVIPLDPSERSKITYLTADTETELQELKEGETYIIGGIVDKNRHKKLCLDKAIELGLKVARLPIGKYIKMNGRQVLATSHVYEIMCMWFDQLRDWEKAFNAVLPPRKLQSSSNDTPENVSEEGSQVSDGSR